MSVRRSGAALLLAAREWLTDDLKVQHLKVFMLPKAGIDYACDNRIGIAAPVDLLKQVPCLREPG